MHCCHVTFQSECQTKLSMTDDTLEWLVVTMLDSQMLLHAGNHGKIFLANLALSLFRLFMTNKMPLEKALLVKALITNVTAVGTLFVSLFHVIL